MIDHFVLTISETKFRKYLIMDRNAGFLLVAAVSVSMSTIVLVLGGQK
jgi:hypothetical protein